MAGSSLSPKAKHEVTSLVQARLPPARREAFARYIERRTSRYVRESASVVEFVESPAYLGRRGELYPKVMEALVELTSGKYQEAVLTGAIGTAKSTLAVYATAWSLYQLSLLRNPHREFGLDPTSEIALIFQSINARTARSVDFERFRALVDGSPYFRQFFPYDLRIESELRFPNRILVRPVTGDITGAIGQNVIGGILDEVNHMSRIERSNRAVDGGAYDQAKALYASIARRRKSRFMRRGQLPGLLCLVGSKRYPGQFTDQRVEAARTDPTIFVYDRRTWEVLPADRFSGEWFTVFVGDAYCQARVMHPEADLEGVDPSLLMRVPLEYLDDFRRDIHEALREIGGVSTVASHPFMANREAIADCIGRRSSLLSRCDVEFETQDVRALHGRIANPAEPRWVHVDLALTGDAAGLVCGHVTGFRKIQRGPGVECLPVIAVDFTLRVLPPRGGEICLERIRQLLYQLTDFGLPVKWVSYDGFQSADSVQQLRRKGYLSDLCSVDKTPRPYEFLKSAIYDRRVETPADECLQKELAALELIAGEGKIDHPPGGSKDVADCLAAVVYGLTMRREIWVRHGVPLYELPASLKLPDATRRSAGSLAKT